MTDKSVTNEKLVAMIVHIACAEIRVILDDTGEEIVENYRLTNVLPLAYRILEGVISLLVIESEDNLEMDYAVLSSIRVALSETFIAVNSFLVERLDLFTLSPDLSIIDNSTTMISMRAYSKWMCEESDYEFDHVDRLIPLVIIYLSMDKFESIDITPIQFLTEILLMISYDAELVDSFVQKGGFKQLVRQFVSIYKTMATSTMISFCSILTNMFMVKTKILANIDSNFGNLLVPIADLITNEQDVTSMDAIANLSIVFVFLYRAPSGSDFIDTDLASMTVQKILQCASMPTVFENDRDLWYMALLALTDCISQTNLSSESKLKAAKQLSKVTDQQSLNAKDQQLIDRLMNVLV